MRRLPLYVMLVGIHVKIDRFASFPKGRDALKDGEILIVRRLEEQWSVYPLGVSGERNLLPEGGAIIGQARPTDLTIIGLDRRP